MSPLAACSLFVLAVMVLMASRRLALLGMLAGVLYFSETQSLQLAGLNMYALRFLEVAGFVRVIGRREFRLGKLNRIDRVFLLLYGYTTLVFLLRSTGHYAYQIGCAVDACLCYFTFRGLLQTAEHFRTFLRDFVVLLVPFVALVLVEAFSAHNVFWSTGAGPEEAWYRGSRVRCHGSFEFAGCLGTLGASFLPLYIGLGFARADRRLAAAGIGLCALIIWESNSGGPVSTAAFALAAWLFWPLRMRMKWVRRGLVGAVLAAGLLMQAPLWYLSARVSAFSGGTGWHRSYLLDKAFQNLGEWGLAGMPLSATSDWFPYALAETGAADITNEFLSFGVAAGVPAIALLILLLTRAFSALGKAQAAVRSGIGGSLESGLLIWGLGAMLAAHAVNWLGVSYFDQIHAVFFVQLAAISAVAASCWEGTEIVAAQPVLAHDDAGGIEDAPARDAA
ncbi:MAG: hypothetical protein ACLQM8_21710 [Limisphaerales bacterium]